MSAEKGGYRPEQSQRRQGYEGFMAAKAQESLGKPEFSSVRRWFTERVGALPEYAVSKTALTGKGGWGHEMTQDGNVDKITGKFFDIPGVAIQVTKPDGSSFGWNQPGIIQKETPVTLPTAEGAMTFDASGFVGVIRDRKGNILLTVGQEPFAKTEKKALARTPFQTSAGKLQGLLDGKREMDPVLADVLDKVGRGRPIAELFANGSIETFPLADADDNRIEATNIGFSMTITDKALHNELAADGKSRWCSPKEVKGLIEAGLVNGHTIAAMSGAPELKRRRGFSLLNRRTFRK